MERAFHLLLGCHLRDREKMVVMLRGMEAHASFYAFYLCDAFDGKFTESFSSVVERPMLDLWQGFITPSFDHSMLCDLLESVTWDYPDMVCVSTSMLRGRMDSFSVLNYRRFVDSLAFDAPKN